MSDSLRYEILVPLQFNSGARVPKPLLSATFEELRSHFGAVSWETQLVRGSWESEGENFEDNLIRFFVDVPGLPEHREFFKEYKNVLETRFDQLKIRITAHRIEVI